MEGVYDENERQPQRVDRVSQRICERGVYSVFMDTSDEKEKHTKRERKERWEGEDKNTSIYFVREWRRTQGREEGQTNKRCSE